MVRANQKSLLTHSTKTQNITTAAVAADSRVLSGLQERWAPLCVGRACHSPGISMAAPQLTQTPWLKSIHIDQGTVSTGQESGTARRLLGSGSPPPGVLGTALPCSGHWQSTVPRSFRAEGPVRPLAERSPHQPPHSRPLGRIPSLPLRPPAREDSLL